MLNPSSGTIKQFKNNFLVTYCLEIWRFWDFSTKKSFENSHKFFLFFNFFRGSPSGEILPLKNKIQQWFFFQKILLLKNEKDFSRKHLFSSANSMSFSSFLEKLPNFNIMKLKNN
jgi:hypothetical protein